jgi:ATP-binding cassette, subfamily C (CFTR/MRP), member 10
MTLMSVDADRASGLAQGLHELWSLPLQLIISLLLLYVYTKYAFLAGLIIVLLLIPINNALARRIQTASIAMMEAKDCRIQLLQDVLHSIHQIKAGCYEDYFASKLNVYRKQELKGLAVKKYLDALCVFFWASTAVLFNTATFSVFVVWTRGRMSVETVFTSIALFGMLLGPINGFPWVINGAVDAVVSIKRLERYFCCRGGGGGERREGGGEGGGGGGGGGGEHAPPQQRDHLHIPLTSSSSSPPLLPPSCLVVITGPTSSGKSSLLTSVSSGHIPPPTMLSSLFQSLSSSLNIKGISTQEPFLMHGTVRSNILFGKPMNEARYNKVIEACCLDEDMTAWRPRGGEMVVGARGVTLSGGQRTRIALARVLYAASCSKGGEEEGGGRGGVRNGDTSQDRDLYLLDDVLAAVDAEVAKKLVEKAIKGYLLSSSEKKVVVMLVSQHAAALNAADYIVTMKNGQIISTVENENSKFDPGSGNPKVAVLEASSSSISESSSHQSTSTSNQEEEQDEEEEEEEEERVIGAVKWSVYGQYLSSVRLVWVVIIVGSLLLMQASRNTSDLWLAHWVNVIASDRKNSGSSSSGSYNHPNSQNSPKSQQEQQLFLLKVLLIIAASNILFTLIRAFSFAKGGMVAAKHMHATMLQAVVVATKTTTFFHSTPHGQIMNRFNSDTATVDDSLPFIFNIFLANAAGLLGTIAILMFCAQSTILLLIVLLPILYVFYSLQQYYRAASRELRRLEAITRSPVYDLFNEVVSNSHSNSSSNSGGGGRSFSSLSTSSAAAMTIRVFKAEQWLMNQAHQAVERQVRVGMSSAAASAWLALRLQLISACFAAVFAAFAVASILKSKPNNNGIISVGLIGLGLTSILPVTGLLNGLLTSGIETEQEMVSVERMMSYININLQNNDSSGSGGDVEAPSSSSSSSSSSSTTFPVLSDSSISKHMLLHRRQRGVGVVFHNVWLQYGNNNKNNNTTTTTTTMSRMALRGVTFKIPPGSWTLLSGRTGSGKSSCFSCLLRLVSTTSGRILLTTTDEVDIRGIPVHVLRKLVALVPQSPLLFQGTLRDNLTIGNSCSSSNSKYQ